MDNFAAAEVRRLHEFIPAAWHIYRDLSCFCGGRQSYEWTIGDGGNSAH